MISLFIITPGLNIVTVSWKRQAVASFVPLNTPPPAIRLPVTIVVPVIKSRASILARVIKLSISNGPIVPFPSSNTSGVRITGTCHTISIVSLSSKPPPTKS